MEKRNIYTLLQALREYGSAVALLALFATHESLLEDHVLSLLTNMRGESCDKQACQGGLVATITFFVHETLRDLVHGDRDRGCSITFDHKFYHAPLSRLSLVSQRSCLNIVIVVAYRGH